jgi:DNA-binding GntR family transcriptional regulator
MDDTMNTYDGGGHLQQAGGEAPSRSEAAYHDLRQRILSLNLKPGALMLEADLAAMLGMSRTPLREATLRLAQEGLVTAVPRRGIQVAPITMRDVSEINQVLACLEIEAVMGVAGRPVRGEEIAALDAAIKAMDAALEAGDIDAWGKADFRFHSLIIELCPNRHLVQTARLYLDKAHRARLLTLPYRKRPVYSNSNHAAVVEAIRRGDPETARDIHAGHKRRWSSELDKIIEQYPEIFDFGGGGE